MTRILTKTLCVLALYVRDRRLTGQFNLLNVLIGAANIVRHGFQIHQLYYILCCVLYLKYRVVEVSRLYMSRNSIKPMFVYITAGRFLLTCRKTLKIVRMVIFWSLYMSRRTYADETGRHHLATRTSSSSVDIHQRRLESTCKLDLITSMECIWLRVKYTPRL